MAKLSNGEQSFLVMEFDDKGLITLPNSLEFTGEIAYLSEGAYDKEMAGELSFHWVKPTVFIDVPIKNKSACIYFKASQPITNSDFVPIKVDRDVVSPTSLNLQGTSLMTPKSFIVSVTSNADVARIRLVSKYPEVRFPNDDRNIAWAIFTPILIKQESHCH